MKPSVLVVDDEQSICSALRRTFHQHQFTVYEAHNGILGLDVLKRHPVDVIISDQRMPGMKGTEFLTMAKQQFPESRRIILSGQSDINDLSDAINKARIHQFISKPWDEAVLLKAVNDHVAAATPTPTTTTTLSATVSARLAATPLLGNQTTSDVIPIYPSHGKTHIELEKAIKNDTLSLFCEAYSTPNTAESALHYLKINWQQFPHINHDNIIDLAKQSGYLSNLYMWYLFKSQEFFEKNNPTHTPIVLDLFCSDFLNNKPLTRLTQFTLGRQDKIIFKIPFESLHSTHFNKTLASLYDNGNRLLLSLGKRIIDVNELAKTPISYIEMDGRQTVINNSLMTEKRLNMISYAEFLSIKTILTGVSSTHQRRYAQVMGFNFCNKT